MSFCGERGIYFRHLHVYYNLLRINTLYHLFYIVPIIYSNNYIVLSTAKIDNFFNITKHFPNFFLLFSLIFCTFASEYCKVFRQEPDGEA